MKGQLKPDAWKISSKLQEEKKSENHAKVLGRGVALSKAGWMQTFYYYRCFFLKIELYEFLWKKLYDIHLRETGLILLLIVLSGIHFATSGIASFLMAEQSWINIRKQVKMLPYH